MVDNALEAAKTNDKVIMTYATPFQKPRDYVLKKLKEGGAQNVTLMYLTMDQDKKLEGLYHRTKNEAAVSGVRHGDFLYSFGENPWAGSSDPSLEEFMTVAKKPGQLGDLAFEGPPPYATVVDVTGRDVSAIDGIDAALGLERSGDDETYDDIVKKVVAVDRKRNDEMPYNVDIVGILAEVDKEVEEALKNAKTEEEKKGMKRRASSILKMTGRVSIGSAASSEGNADA